MNYNASVTDFFKNPKWGMNMLLGAVAILIPIIGPIVLGGWHVTGFWARGDDEDPAKFPPFDFQYFGKYLERGLWPFLVNLAASLVLIPLMMCLMIPLFLFISIVGPGIHQDKPALTVVALFVGLMILQFGLMLAYQFIITPLMVAATITQDFKSAFRMDFVVDFLSLVWKEQIASLVFMFGLALCGMILTIITCYIGMFFAVPITIFSWHHLQKQIYQLYLARGGEPIPLSPKLQDVPPRLPGA
jgi:hypothetical protein